MGEQHGLLEAGAILGGHRHRQADPGQIGEGLLVGLMQGEGTRPARVGSTLRPNCSASLKP